VLVPFKELYAVISKARRLPISFDVNPGQFSIESNGKPLFTSPLSYQLDEFPLDFPVGACVYTHSFDLTSLLVASSFAYTKDERYEELHNVAISESGVAAADGYRLFVDHVETGASRIYLLPSSIVDGAKHIVNTPTISFYTDTSEKDAFYATITGATKHGATLVLSHAPVDSHHYPEVERIMPLNFAASFAFLASDAIAALDLVAPVCKEVANVLTVCPKSNNTLLFDASADSKTASAPLAIHWSRMPEELSELGVNVLFLRDSIKALSTLGADEILFSYNGVTQPFVLSASDRSSNVTARVVIMPMSLN